ncbi:MAG: hypothetical protein PHX13_00975 [Thiovulaceae bacterium]|nr:hypothetical protein [Sulfurimonadaceae bacterium]
MNENQHDKPTFNLHNFNEALKSADISPLSSFNKYAVAAIAKTTPALKKYLEKKDEQMKTSRH